MLGLQCSPVLLLLTELAVGSDWTDCTDPCTRAAMTLHGLSPREVLVQDASVCLGSCYLEKLRISHGANKV